MHEATHCLSKLMSTVIIKNAVFEGMNYMLITLKFGGLVTNSPNLFCHQIWYQDDIQFFLLDTSRKIGKILL